MAMLCQVVSGRRCRGRLATRCSSTMPIGVQFRIQFSHPGSFGTSRMVLPGARQDCCAGRATAEPDADVHKVAGVDPVLRRDCQNRPPGIRAVTLEEGERDERDQHGRGRHEDGSPSIGGSEQDPSSVEAETIEPDDCYRPVGGCDAVAGFRSPEDRVCPGSVAGRKGSGQNSDCDADGKDQKVVDGRDARWVRHRYRLCVYPVAAPIDSESERYLDGSEPNTLRRQFRVNPDHGDSASWSSRLTA